MNSDDLVTLFPSRTHLGTVEADDHICRVSSVQVWSVVILIVHKNIQGCLQLGDEGFCPDRADHHQSVELALLAVQRGGHQQLRGVLADSKRRWRVCNSCV